MVEGCVAGAGECVGSSGEGGVVGGAGVGREYQAGNVVPFNSPGGQCCQFPLIARM